MIYSPGYRFAFVHIPRCAGLSLTRTLAELSVVSCVVDTCELRHATAGQIAALVGSPWSGWFRFAVMRNPWRIMESDYRLCLRDVAFLSVLSGPWASRVRAAVEGDFAAFVRREYLQGQLSPGGFWATWVGEEQVEHVPFDALESVWTAPYPGSICDRIEAVSGKPFQSWGGGVGAAPPLPRINHAGPVAPVSWTADLIRDVRELCADDLNRFNYPDKP